MSKFLIITLNAAPIILMVALIPFVGNDIWLAAIYGIIIGASFSLKIEKNEIKIFIFGLLIMIFFETIFIQTGVETFERNSLLGIMPLWLPPLWGYAFVAMKRVIKILDI